MWYGYDYIDKNGEYVLRNIPATIQKDKLFLALARGVMKNDNDDFKMPDSVVKLGIITGSNPPQVAEDGYSGSITYEYFKKGKEPEKVTATKLNAPTGLKVSYSGDKVTITWNGVSKLEKDEGYGDFGYNVYQGNRLLTFTSGTSYTFKTATPYDTYKVVATYKSYSGAQSDAATYQLKEEQKAEVTTFACSQTAFKVGDTIPTNTCTFKVNSNAVTPTSIKVDGTSDCHDGIKFTTAKTCTVKYLISYNNKSYNASVNYTITADSGEDPDPNTPTVPTTP